MACDGRGEFGWLAEAGAGGGPIVEALRDNEGEMLREVEVIKGMRFSRGEGGTLFRSGGMVLRRGECQERLRDYKRKTPEDCSV